MGASPSSILGARTTLVRMAAMMEEAVDMPLMQSLNHCKSVKLAKHGERGYNKGCTGKNAQHTIMPVPLGARGGRARRALLLLAGSALQAHVGLLGAPNAGESTLLRALAPRAAHRRTLPFYYAQTTYWHTIPPTRGTLPRPNLPRRNKRPMLQYTTLKHKISQYNS